MSFRETLDKHTSAIIARDIEALRSTLPEEELVLVMSDGKVVRSVSQFVDAHRQWFASRRRQWRGIDPYRRCGLADKKSAPPA